MVRKILTIMITLLLVLMIPSMALAVNLSLNLSSSTANPGATITASGTADPNANVFIKMLDSNQNIVDLEVVKADVNGNYTKNNIEVPSLPGSTLAVVAGYGPNVAVKTLYVNNGTEGTELAPPALTADNSGNMAGSAADLEFTDNAAWRTAISGITVDTTALTAGQYTITPGNINLYAGAFSKTGDYVIVVKATGYTDASVIQTIQQSPSGNSSGNSSGSGSGSSSSAGGNTDLTGTNSGTITKLNQNALSTLTKTTPEQIQNAQLPAEASAVDPASMKPTTLTTKDGVQLVVPAGAVGNQSGPVQITVALGTITTPPRALNTALVLNPLKYQRQFGVQGAADGSFQFSEPVTITFPISTVDLPAGTVPQQLTVCWWDLSSNDWVKLGGVFDAATNTISVPTYHFSTYAVMADTSSAPNRLAGTDRFSTAIVVAEQGWKTGADNVILANAYIFPDALAAGPLAHKLNAPILLTDAAALTPPTLAEIQKLAPQKITIIGGTAVISQAIQDSLSATYGKDNVTRYGGVDRYATAADIAAALGTTGKAVIANGEDGHYPDALAISSYAAYNGIPILFTETAGLPAATAQVLTAQKVNTTIVIGGDAVVPAVIFNQLPGATRYSGTDRYETATAIASGLHLNVNNVYVVTGLDFPDALVVGNWAAKSLSPLIMVDKGVPAATSAFLSDNKSRITGLTVVGGEGTITASQESALRNALK